MQGEGDSAVAVSGVRSVIQNAATNGNGGRRTSQVLRDLIADTTRVSFTFREIAQVIGERAFGALLFLFALPNLIPIPGISTVFGILIGIIAIQLMLGSRTIWLPRKVAERGVSRDALAAVIDRTMPRMQRVERILRPRLNFLCLGVGERLIGVFCLAMALILMLPLVLNNLFPALAAAAFALGIIERDGVAVIAGYLLSVVAVIVLGLTLAVGTAAIVGFLKGIVYIFRHVPA